MIFCSGPIIGNNRPLYFELLFKKSKGLELTAPMCENVSIYKDTVVFDDSLFYRVVTGSTYLIIYQKVTEKDVHTLFLGR